MVDSLGAERWGKLDFCMETEIHEIPEIEKLLPLPQYATAHLFSSGPSLLLQPGTISWGIIAGLILSLCGLKYTIRRPSWNIRFVIF